MEKVTKMGKSQTIKGIIDVKEASQECGVTVSGCGRQIPHTPLRPQTVSVWKKKIKKKSLTVLHFIC